VSVSSVSERLRAARRAAGMTQEQLALALHVSRTAVSHWETGRYEPDEGTLEKLSLILGRDLSAEAFADDGGASEFGTMDGREGEPGFGDHCDEPKSLGRFTGAAPKPGLRLSDVWRRVTTASRRLALGRWLGAVAALAVLAIAAATWLAVSRPSLSGTAVGGEDRGAEALRLEDFLAGSSPEAGRAHVSVAGSVEPGGAEGRCRCTFRMCEECGIAFHADGAELVVFYQGRLQRFPCSGEELERMGIVNALLEGRSAVYEDEVEIDAGACLGIGFRIEGRDPDGGPLSFSGFAPWPDHWPQTTPAPVSDAHSA